MGFQGRAVPGIVHHFAPRLTAFEHTPPTHQSSAPNVLLWIGGLFDGLLTVPYPSAIAASLPPTWTLAQVLLSSAYTGWGTSSLVKDASELSQAVTYFRSAAGGSRRKVVLMGHSTGCQDVMEYLVGPGGYGSRAAIEGGILQAPVSDREAIVEFFSASQYAESVAVAKRMIAEGRGTDSMPVALTKGFTSQAVCTATRWLSLTSPEKDGADDYFSSDLGDEKLRSTFGKLPKSVKLGILFSGSDQYVPKWVDKEALVKRWIKVAKEGTGVVDEAHSGVVKGASHNLLGDPEEVVTDLVKRVLGFLEGV